MTLPRVPRVPRFRLAAVLLALALPASAASPPDPAAGSATLLASLAADGTAVFWGAETNGAYCPPTFAAAVRFRPGEAAATALSNAVRLVVADEVSEIPAGCFAGLPALRTVVLPSRTRSVGPGAFADCPALSNAVLRGSSPCEIAADAFARCSPALSLAFVARTDTARVAWTNGPVPFVRGLGGAGGGFDGRLRTDSWGDWAFPDGSARYTGPRIEGAYLFRVRPDGTADLIRKLDPGAPDPVALDGAPVYSQAEIDERAVVGEARVEGDFRFRIAPFGVDAQWNRRKSAPEAVLLNYGGTNEVLSLPAALGGVPLVRLERGSLAGTPVRGLRIPASVRSCRLSDADLAGKAIWCDGIPPSDLQENSLSPRYFASSADRRDRLAERWWRALPAETDVEALLARGTNGPPVSGAFEFVPLAGGRGAAVTGLAARPGGDALEIPAELGGLPVVEIADLALSAAQDYFWRPSGPVRPTILLFVEMTLRQTEEDADGSTRDIRRAVGDGSSYTNRLAIVVPEGVRRIGARAFEGFVPMASIRLPASLEEIGPGAFSSCPLLREAVVPPGVREIPAAAFAGCRALEAVVLDAPAVRIAPFAFAACPALVAVTTAGEPAAVDPWAFVDSPRARILPRASAAPAAPEAAAGAAPAPSQPPSDRSVAGNARTAPSAREAASRIAERFGHPATATVTVVDAAGAPVPGAWIEWRFPAPERQRFGVDAVEGLARADSNGVARVEGPHFGSFEAALVDPATGMRFARGAAAAPDRRAPGPFDFALTLADTPAARAVGATTGKRSWWSDAEGWRSEAYTAALLDESAVDALFAREGAPVGLDLARRALLPPVGDGETADCYLRAFRHWPEDAGLALEGIEVMQNAQCTMHNEPASPHSSFSIHHSSSTNEASSLYLRSLPPWSNGRRRRVGHLLPPPCDWSSTNGWTGAAPAPWHALADSAPLRVPVRSRGADGWVEIGPDGTRWSGLHISGFLPVERKPFVRLPGIEEDRIWRGFPPQRGFLAVGKTVDGAACLLGPCDLDGRTPCAPNSFPGASRIALFEQSSEAPQFLAGVDTLVVPSFVEEIPDHAFENCGDLRCVVLEPGVRRIGARAFAGCTNLSAVVVLPFLSGTGRGPMPAVEAADDSFAGCSPDIQAYCVHSGRHSYFREQRLGLPRRSLPAADGTYWRHTPRGLSYIGPRVLDGWLWTAAPLPVRSGSSTFVRLSDSTLPAGTLSVIPPPPETNSPSSTPLHLTVPSSVASHPVYDLDATWIPAAVESLELPPTLRRAYFQNRVPAIVRTTDPATDLALNDREPRLLFFPPGRYWWHPFGVNVGLTRLIPAYADLDAQLAVPHQNRDCGGWLWVPVGDDAAELVGYRGPAPTNGVLRIPAFVGPEDRRPDIPSADAPPAGARRVVSLSPYLFRRHDASAERERGPRFALEIPEGVETIGAFAFENTLRIESVRLPSTLRSLGPGAFSNCGNLKAVDLPENVKEIPAGCFLGCAALERVSAPGATAVDALAFAGCERLVSLSLAPGAALHPAALLDTPSLVSKPRSEPAE